MRDPDEDARTLSAELLTIRIDDPGAPLPLAPIREFLALETLLVFCPEERLHGWGLERIDLDGFASPSRFARMFEDYLATAPHRFWDFDPSAPAAEQRDRVVDIDPGATHVSAKLRRDVLEPHALTSRRQVRALLTESLALVGWVGGFHTGRVDAEHRRRLTTLLPAFRTRLACDRALRRRPVTASSLQALLDEICDPTFVVGPRGHLTLANQTGRAWLDRDRGEVAAAVSSAMSGRVSVDARCIQLRGVGLPPFTLIRFKSPPELVHIDRCAERMAERWFLTPRQRDVLQLLARGHGNAAIAAELGIGDRAVEFHVSAILDRAAVDTRTKLVLCLLGER